METPRQTRSSVLGKRAHRSELSSSNVCEQLATPDPTPTLKRVKTATTELDGDHNKENIPPFITDAFNATSARATRALRRAATELDVSPTRRRSSASDRRASTSSISTPTTPVSEVSELTLNTPPPTPTKSLPIHARVRGLLRATCDSTFDMPGRVEERAVINDFITSYVDDTSVDDISTLYISGSPGTGKTAIVNSLLRDLHKSNVKIVTVNCMALNNVDALWDRLLEDFATSKKRKIAGRAKRSIKGKEAVQDLLCDLSGKCVLILDELDHIAPNTQSLTSLFSLSTSNMSALRVIGIANTHTLTASNKSFASTVKTLHFAPYTPPQLLQILQARIVPLRDSGTPDATKAIDELLPTSALSFLTKKIAALTGDVRSLFEVLRGAIGNAVAAAQSPSSPVVTIAHIVAAVKAHMPSTTKSACPTGNSETINKVKVLGLQARLVLASILMASKRMEAGLTLVSSSAPSSPTKRSSSPKFPTLASGGLELSTLHSFYSMVLSRNDDETFTAVSRSEFNDLLGMLEGVGLLSTTSSFASASPTKVSKRGLSRTVSMASAASLSGEVKLCEGVWVEEVVKGLGIHDDATQASENVMDEEVSSMWHREMMRMSREVKAIEAKTAKEKLETFGDAMEN